VYSFRPLRRYIIVRTTLASWAGLICRTHQHYHHQWLPNTE